MAQPKKKWVAFRSNAIIPDSVFDQVKDHKAMAGVPIQLPAGYADHVVHDRFAMFCDAPKRSKTSPVKDPNAEKREAAQKLVDDIEAKMSDIAETDNGWADLAKQLDDARTALAEFEPAT